MKVMELLESNVLRFPTVNVQLQADFEREDLQAVERIVSLVIEFLDNYNDDGECDRQLAIFTDLQKIIDSKLPLRDKLDALKAEFKADARRPVEMRIMPVVSDVFGGQGMMRGDKSYERFRKIFRDVKIGFDA